MLICSRDNVNTISLYVFISNLYDSKDLNIIQLWYTKNEMIKKSFVKYIKLE